MLLKDIKSADELVTYLENRQLCGIKSEDGFCRKFIKVM